MKKLIEISHVNRVFSIVGGEFQALKDINASIEEGTLTILKGRSGSGKTTLMNIASALDFPTSGTVCIGGNDITKKTIVYIHSIFQINHQRTGT